MLKENKNEFVSFEQEEKEKQEAWAWAAFVAEEKRKQKESDDKHWMSQSQQAVASAFRGNWSEAWSHVGERYVLRSADLYFYLVNSLLYSSGCRRNNECIQQTGKLAQSIRAAVNQFDIRLKDYMKELKLK